MKKINVTSSSFEKLIIGDALYVDKTEYVWRLVDSGDTEFFLSRPRRFGKSLLVSTLKAIFQGRRELFKGLAIDKKDYDWKEYPVIHLDFGNCDVGTPERLEVYLNHLLDMAANELGIELKPEKASIRFENLIGKAADASAAGSAVVLIDEYDKPILGNITNKEHNKAILSVLKGFYANIKKKEEIIRFAFITGVSKFAHVSLFSDLNNLADVTLDVDYACMLGFTEADIREYFADRIPLAAKANGMSEEELMTQLLKWYDGYRFSKAATHVCNPVSISKFFERNYDFANYWGKTGMPGVLMELAKRTRFNFEKAVSMPVSDLVFGSYELDDPDTMGLLWQTGYLTIKEVLPGPLGSSMYRLGFPDFEVEQSFNTQLLAYYSGYKDSAMSSVVFQLTSQIQENRIDDFMKSLQSFFSSIPYDIRGGDEHYYQTIFFITFLLLGASIEAESRTSDGRIDAVVATQDHVFIFEFKLDKPAPKALEQIEDKEYYLKYRMSGKDMTLIGASFDQDKGKLTDWCLTSL